ncbi:MAG: hypothetical protein RIG68_02125 [Imperialibacter sp.]|uniref:hypothetical protein n=1 Tax=Imperialibacter sp. TaxID=2038411 RepID=UPI0032EB945A
MKSKNANTTKILLLGVIVAVVSLLSSLNGSGFVAGEGALTGAAVGQKDDAMRVEAKLQLEKLATSKKLAKEIDQNFTAGGNTMVN